LDIDAATVDLCERQPEPKKDQHDEAAAVATAAASVVAWQQQQQYLSLLIFAPDFNRDKEKE